MKRLSKFGSILVVLAVLIAVAGVVYFTADRGLVVQWLQSHRLAVTFLGCAVVGALIALYPWRATDARTLAALIERERFAPPAGGDVQSATSHPGVTHPLHSLREHLRADHGWRWRTRQPWLLLTGDKATVQRLLPSLEDHGWLQTDDAILLWNGTGHDTQPDPAWLKQLRKLRPNRPIDGIVLIKDGDVALTSRQRGTSTDSLTLARIAATLKWSAPVYVLDVAGADAANDGTIPIIGSEFNLERRPPQDATAIANALLSLRDQLSQRGIAGIAANVYDSYLAELSQRLDKRSTLLAAWIASVGSKARHHQPIRGAFFAPYPLDRLSGQSEETGADLAIWQHLAQLSRRARGQRVGLHPVTVFSTVVLVVVGVWTTGMTVSALTNAHEVHLTGQALHSLKTAPDAASGLRALLAVQHRIKLYEHRVNQHAPLWTRFGLNQDRATLAALWTPYGQSASRLLITPIQNQLEAKLMDLGQMQTSEVSEHTNQAALDGHQALKAYLMLAEPSRTDAGFITPVLERHWPGVAGLTHGEKLDLGERLLRFYADHLGTHTEWQIAPEPDLVASARQTLQAIIVVKNSEDIVYQSVLDAVGNKYPDQTLATVTPGTDPRGLFRTNATVPGVFTRQAYEGSIAAEINKAAERSATANDWVLNTQGNPVSEGAEAALSGDALKAELTERYFSDYADAWQAFMNSLVWERAASMPAAIEQLKPMADARQSPVTSLIKTLAWQGGAGAPKASLSDTLVAKAQNVFGRKDEAPEAQKPDPAGPLGPAFDPILRLVAQDNANATGDLSLQRYLDRVTALRLKLQQMSNSPDADAQAKQVALALFQGKGSDLADIQHYADQIAASLGAQWAGMGEALFVQPVAQATQTILLPAQASLNDAWRQTIASTWNQSFAGRYPFANTENDASLPELARFLRPQGGLINSFLGSQLAGVLELQGDRWVPVGRAFGTAAGGDSLAFDPEFLRAINTLQKIAAHMLVQGEPQYRFDFQPVPTPGLTDTRLTLDGQILHYYNQRETWHALTWPANPPLSQSPGTRLQWQTEQAGTNKNLEYTGRWSLVRLLERAQVEPMDSATLQLTWQARPDAPATPTPAEKPHDDAEVARQAMAPAPQQLTYPIRYLMRTEVGKGPLELLALRGFALPQRIFAGRGGQSRSCSKACAKSGD